MRIVRFVLSSLLVFILISFVSCMKDDCCSHQSYFLFGKYFVPTKIRLAPTPYSVTTDVYLHYRGVIEGMSNPEFRALAAEYGEKGGKLIHV